MSDLIKGNRYLVSDDVNNFTETFDRIFSGLYSERNHPLFVHSYDEWLFPKGGYILIEWKYAKEIEKKESIFTDNTASEMREELFNKMNQHIIQLQEENQALRDRLDAKEYALQEALTTIRLDKMAMEVKNV